MHSFDKPYAGIIKKKKKKKNQVYVSSTHG